MKFLRTFAALTAILLGAVSSAQTFRIGMIGARESPAGDPDGVGLAVLTIDGATLRYFLWAKGVDAPTAAHVHQGRAGTNGGVVVSLDPTFVSVATDTYAASGGVAIPPDVLAGIALDPTDYYVNVHNGPFPGGAMRGQLLGDGPSTVALATSLRGFRESPAGDPDGVGVAAVAFADGNAYYYLWVKDIAAPTAAHIHTGSAGQNGGVVLGFSPTFNNGVATGVVTVAADLVAAIQAKPSTYYVNVHTGDFPGGALRGQLEPTETVRHFPVLANNPGLGTSNFHSDVMIQNLQDETSTAYAEWYPANAGGMNAPLAVAPVSIPARGAAVLVDAVSTLFSTNNRGAVRLVSSTPFHAVANVYNDQRPNGGGTFGQGEEALVLDRAFKAGALPFGSHEPKSDGHGFRTNIGYFNPTQVTVNVTFNVRKPDGTLLASQTIAIPGFANDIVAYASLISGVPADQQTQAAFLITYSADGPIFIYNSVVDNITDDSLFEEALEVPAGITTPPTS